MLVGVFGCPGDDSTNDTGMTTQDTTSTTNGPTTTNGTTSDDDTTSNGTTTSEDTTTNGEGSESSSGGVNQACVDFCSDFLDTCSNFDDYNGMDGCLMTCDAFDQAELDCRVMHVGLAQDDPDTHCPHASRDGGGVC